MNIFSNEKEAKSLAKPIDSSSFSDRLPHKYPSEETDSIIWREFKEGSEAAFKFIYSQYFDVLYQYGTQFTTDHDLIKDLIQDFFIDLRLKRKGLGDTTSIKYYLFKSLRRKLTRYLKKNHHITLLGSFYGISSFEVSLSIETTLINQQLTEEKKERLQTAFSKLPTKQREAIFYVYYQDISYKEVASIMGLMTVKSARNLVYKAFNTIRKEMERYQ